MKRFVKRAVLMLGIVALLASFAPWAEAGGRRHYRSPHVGPGYVVTGRSHYGYSPYRSVYRARVYRVPVVVVPLSPVPYSAYYRGPSDYFHGYAW